MLGLLAYLIWNVKSKGATMPSEPRGVLQNRTAVVLVLLALSFITVQSWLRITRPSPFPRDPVELFGLAFSIFITACIAFRSSFAWDRTVFGVALIALVMAGITGVFSLAPSVMFAFAAAKAIMWTTAAVASAVVLVRGLRHRSY
jgi:hypothetical protein